MLAPKLYKSLRCVCASHFAAVVQPLSLLSTRKDPETGKDQSQSTDSQLSPGQGLNRERLPTAEMMSEPRPRVSLPATHR